MKVGNVIKNNSGIWVITKTDEKGAILDFEYIDDFICNNAVVVDLHGEHKTIREIIEERKEIYLDKNKIIDLVSWWKNV